MSTRSMMNGKQVFTRRAKTVINFDSNFRHKQLCDGPTFSAGDACVYKCGFCYVPDLIRKLRATPVMAGIEGKHEDIVIRRENAAEIAMEQLRSRNAKDCLEKKVIYASPLVDVAGNVELVRETVAICKVILNQTAWDIRLLSKSNLLPMVAKALEEFSPGSRARVIYGVSTGTLNDNLAKAFEEGTPLVSKRIESLHWLQDNGFRTYGMVCPSLPLADKDEYYDWAESMAKAIRADRCEHVWAEVINLRGESFKRTMEGLQRAGFHKEAGYLREVSEDRELWEWYARRTYSAHLLKVGGKLRFLQYVRPQTREWWGQAQYQETAIML